MWVTQAYYASIAGCRIQQLNVFVISAVVFDFHEQMEFEQ